MLTAIVCTGLLAILVFGLGLGVSATRGSTSTNIGSSPDPRDRLHQLVRAPGNATEYAPMLAILMLLLGSREPAWWMTWVFVAATAARYVHAAGMITCESLAKPNPLRFAGALLTYVLGLVMGFAALFGA